MLYVPSSSEVPLASMVLDLIRSKGPTESGAQDGLHLCSRDQINRFEPEALADFLPSHRLAPQAQRVLFILPLALDA